MRYLVAVVCLLMSSSANAKDFTKTAKSGQTTMMATYRSWNKQCESKRGIVKVISKPAHGELTPTEVTTKIGVSRFHPERTTHCVGLPTNGFRVTYTSSPGFHGVDHFVLQFDYGMQVDIDNFTVNVE
jgi:hypothetical protein